MTTLRFILGDQLDRDIAALTDLDVDRDVVFLCEVREEATYVRHHKKKIAFLFSAMRHFAAELKADGVTVDYARLDDAENTGSFTQELARAVARHGATRVIVTEPGEWRVWEAMRGWSERLGVPVEIREDRRFFASRAEFAHWAKDRKTLRMEFFYREMRKKTGLLMDGVEPAGGQWNFDHDNRKRLPDAARPPRRLSFAPDAITNDVLDLIEARFADHFGNLRPFTMPVTRAEALQVLDHFIADALADFGDYQDAMKAGEPFLYHSLISAVLNCGLLNPREVCVAAERAYRAGRAPLNAVEGFIRQVLGWREYVRGLYWTEMPGYAATNALNADRPLPWFFWSGETDMACLRHVIEETRQNAYAHHIQRLMVTGNFALLAGLAPAEVEAWYLIVYADAYDWVELPNVHGMVLHADGGLMASKPYAASGAYIDRMSDYCSGCRYDVKAKAGPKACPFNVLYWDFIARHEERLGRNPRMVNMYATWRRMSEARRAEIRSDAARFLKRMDAGDRV